MNEPRKNSRLRLRITAAAETQLRAGHPWIFADSVRDQNRPGKPGELAVIYDRNDEFLAIGLFDPDSPIRFRVLHRGKPATLDSGWWNARLASAIERRSGWFDARTSGYRLINGESDGWPGLVLDRYDRSLVLKIYTAAWRTRLAEISGLMVKQLAPDAIVLRTSRNLAPDASGPRDGELIFEKRSGTPVNAPVVFQETGLWFEADVWRGQKTGFFLDQRENRRRVETLSRGRRVLNAFSFSGGFSLYAARGGASSATDLDLSAHALDGAKRNFILNAPDPAVAHCHHERVRADAFAWLEANDRRVFDLVILDPPSLAKRESERSGAIRAYEQLASLGLKHLSRGGILVACSCSAHVSAEEFFDAVRRSAAKSGRRPEELHRAQHPPDHPATFKEAEYLKAIYLKCS